MKNILKYFFTVLSSLGYIVMASAQDVYIEIPTSSIFNRSEYITVERVMNTQGHSSWRAGAINPKIRSISGNEFRHTDPTTKPLPASVLHWRLASIGGKTPVFSKFDSWPDYKWFTSSYQTWYHPSILSSFRAGNIDFSFKVPQSQIADNAFHAGKYKIEVEQDYGRSGFYIIEFSPENFNTYISISEDIRWIVMNDSKYHEITSLNQFRTGSSPILINLGPMEIGHTIDFDLYARSDDKEVKFKSLNGDNRKFDVSVVKLGSNHPKIATIPLNKNRKNYTPNSHMTVEKGNRSNFELQLSISNEDFKTYFFEAGRYEFQIEVDARGIHDSKSSDKDIDVTIAVPALSEISMLGGNTEVNFTFNTMLQYHEGQSQTIPNQIRISNNENYELYVKSSANFFNSNGIQSDLNASVLEVSIEGNSHKAALSKTAQKIIKNGAPTLDKDLNVTYTISPSAAQSLIPKEKKSYGINVIYSFTAL